MEPAIQFCTSADGTRIAYMSYGSSYGPTVVVLPAFVFDAESVWSPSNPGAPMTLERRLAEDRRVISFDRRGWGASQREVHDLSLDVQVQDLAAAVDEAQVDRFDIWAMNEGVAVALAYAAEHPDRVSRLFLEDAYERPMTSIGPARSRGSSISCAPTGPLRAEQ